jgi:hypothetical protein
LPLEGVRLGAELDGRHGGGQEQSAGRPAAWTEAGRVRRSVRPWVMGVCSPAPTSLFLPERAEVGFATLLSGGQQQSDLIQPPRPRKPPMRAVNARVVTEQHRGVRERGRGEDQRRRRWMWVAVADRGTGSGGWGEWE